MSLLVSEVSHAPMLLVSLPDAPEATTLPLVFKPAQTSTPEMLFTVLPANQTLSSPRNILAMQPSIYRLWSMGSLARSSSFITKLSAHRQRGVLLVVLPRETSTPGVFLALGTTSSLAKSILLTS